MSIYCCKTTFTKGGLLKTGDCVANGEIVFKALIDAKPPYQTVNVNARDIYRNRSAIVEKLAVLPPPSIIETFWNTLYHAANLLKHLFQNGPLASNIHY